MVRRMPEQLEGTVERVRFYNEATHWTVATLRAGGRPTAVVGLLPGLAEGMEVRLDGAWVEDSRYGRQFKAASYQEIIPATKEGLSAYLASGFIKGIGAKMARRIVEHFGEDTLDIISQDPERLREVSGLGAKRVETIIAAFKERRGAQEALIFLFGLGITAGLANKIYQRYGDDTMRLVRTNPYRLAEEVHGIGFHKADQVAAGLQIRRDHPARTRAGVYHLLLEARGEGHCFLPRGLLTERAAQLLGVDAPEIERAIAALAFDRRIVVDEPAGGGVAEEESIYLAYLYDCEVGVARLIAQMLGSAGGPPNVDDKVEDAATELGITLAPGQAAAVRLALTSGTAIITGGPGTGKTTIIQTLLKASGLPAERVALAAPTGRAAKRLSEATGREGRTIHRLLEYSPGEGGFQRDEGDPLDVDLVIVDEASMLDLPLFYALARAIPEGGELLLVGDVDQLPPVGPGSPLTDLIRSERVPVARLTEIFRQGAGSAIIESAHAVNRGVVPQPTPRGTPLQDFYFVVREPPEAILKMIERLVSERIPERFGFDPIEDIQVLTPMRGGIIGVDYMNERLQALLNPDGESLTVGSTTYRVGDKVMQIRNDYDRNVFNGDVGTVYRVLPRDKKVIVVIDGREVVYTREQLDELVLAYAVSIHKSQGSEYSAVVIPISTSHFKMLQRNLIYTALTRGKRLVVLVGTQKALGIAVKNAEMARRNTRLAERVGGQARGGLL